MQKVKQLIYHKNFIAVYEKYENKNVEGNK